MSRLASHVAAPLHRRLVAGRRVVALARALQRMLPAEPLTGLDIGCGNGALATLVQGVEFTGCDVLVRPDALIPVTQYDGHTLPFPDDSFDFALLVDVLHHVDDPQALLREARRVARRFVIVKDHYCENPWNHLVLRFMDWVGNRAYGVALPYNYQSRAQWRRHWREAGLEVEAQQEKLRLYPWPFRYLFEMNLHFMARAAKVPTPPPPAPAGPRASVVGPPAPQTGL